MKLIQQHKKLLIGLGIAVACLSFLVWSVAQIFVAEKPVAPTGMAVAGTANDPAAGGAAADGEGPTYQLATLYPQEPIAVDGQAQLQTDNSYYYEADRGKIEAVSVRDGQFVKKGDVLFSYQSDKDQARYDLEDAHREQTRLYNQRETLVDQLRQATGLAYNYQGDQIGSYWEASGKQVYVIEQPIGKAGVATTAPAAPETGADASADGVGADLAAADAGVEGIKQQIRQVNQQIEDVEIKLIRLQEQQYGRVTAKNDGRALVDLRGQDDRSYPLVRVVSDDVSVTGAVSEYDFHLLAEDRPVELFVNAEERVVKGTMISYDQVPQGQQAPAEADTAGAGPGGGFSGAGGSQPSVRYGFIVQPEEPIQPGFTVKVRMTLPGLVVPQQAIVEEGDRHYVFVYRNGQVHRQEVKLIRQGIQQVAVRDLKAGDQLVLEPAGLKDGQPIQAFDPNELAMTEAGMMDEEPGHE